MLWKALTVALLLALVPVGLAEAKPRGPMPEELGQPFPLRELTCPQKAGAATGEAPRSPAPIGLSFEHNLVFDLSGPVGRRLCALVAAQRIRSFRAVVPWDVLSPARCRPDADPDPVTNCRGLETFVQNVERFGRANGIRTEPYIALAPSDAQPDPPPAAFRAEFRRLAARFPSVRIWAAWNEPDHERQRLERGWDRQGLTAAQKAAALRAFAAQVARYWVAAHSVVPHRLVLAGELANPEENADFFTAYRDGLRAAGARPRVWSYHAYRDISELPASGPSYPETDAMVRALGPEWGDPDLWMTEGAAALLLGGKPTPLAGNADPDLAALGVARFLALPRVEPRVRRLFYYQLAAGDASSFDSSLLESDGQATRRAPGLALLLRTLTGAPPPSPSPRPAYCALVGRPLSECPGDNRPSVAVDGSS